MLSLFNLFIVIVVSLFTILAFLDRKLALIIFVFLLPTYLLRLDIPISLGPLNHLPTTLLELLFFALLLSWLATHKYSEARHNLEPWGSGLLLLFVGSVIGVLIAPDTLSALGIWRAYFLEPILFLIIFVETVKDAKMRRNVIGALGIAVMIIGVLAIIQKFTGWWIPNPIWAAAETRRVTAFYGFPNGIGLFVAPIVVLMTAWAISTTRKVIEFHHTHLPLFAGWSAFLGVLAVLFAVSEGALIGLAAGLLVLGLIIRPLRKVTLVVVIAVCLMTALYPPLRTYASDMISMRDDSWGVRKIVWAESVDMLSDRPIWGAGIDGYQQALEPYHQAKHIEIFKYPHNFLLNFWSETGIIGLAGFFLLLAAFFRVTVELAATRPKEWLPVALIAAMMTLLMHGMVDVPYFKNDLAMLFFVLIGLAESMRRQQIAVDQPAKS